MKERIQIFSMFSMSYCVYTCAHSQTHIDYQCGFLLKYLIFNFIKNINILNIKNIKYKKYLILK